MQNCSDDDSNADKAKPASDETRQSVPASQPVLWMLGLMLAVAIGYLAVTLHGVLAEKCSLAREANRGLDAAQVREAMTAQQMEEIRAGKIDCLVNPAPESVDELLADPACVKNVTTLYLGSDVSDPRLARLHDLPNLKSLIFYWTEHPEVFLEHMRGKKSIEAISFDRSDASREGIEHIATLPNLKSLCVSLYGLKSSDLEPLKSHASIENLFLTRATCDKELIPILQSLPRLKSLTIGFQDASDSEFWKSLREALPNCECENLSYYR
jgi:hypothetical protein